MEIKVIKKTLRGLGLYHGKLDNTLNDKFTLSIKAFQRINPPLVVDGIIGPKTLGELSIPNFKPDQQTNIEAVYDKINTNQTKVILPYKMKLAWDTNIVINKFTCHRMIVLKLELIFTEILSHYGRKKIQELGLDLFGGCLNVRKTRGGSSYSTHSWGIAVDLHPAGNRLTWNDGKAVFAKKEYDKFWQIVEDNGGVSLGRVKNYDWMHFQFINI